MTGHEIRAQPPQSPALLQARGLCKSFGRRRPVLADLDLQLAPGRVVGITGENGSGKTTLLKLLVGLLRPDAGTLVVSGRLGYCPQEPLVFERLTIRENFAFFASAYGLPDWVPGMHELLERFRLAESERRLVAEVSGGTRQKLNLCLALLHDPAVLLLDEPYSGFDWESYLAFWSRIQELKRLGKSVLVVSHFIYDRARLDVSYDLRDGRLECA